MKQVKWILVIEAIACLFLFGMIGKLNEGTIGIFLFPFGMIGQWLRMLSLSSAFGNIIAWLLYVFIGLLPIGIRYIVRKKYPFQKLDILIPIMSMMLFVTMYLMINPMEVDGMISFLGKMPLRAILNSILIVVIMSYLVLWFYQRLAYVSATRLRQYVAILLVLISIIIVFEAFGIEFASLMESIKKVKAGNTALEVELGWTYFIMILQYLVKAISSICMIPILFSGYDLLKANMDYPYTEIVIHAADYLCKLCGRVLKLTVFVNVGYCVVLLILLETVHQVNLVVEFPLNLVVVIIASLLLARYLKSTKQIKDENDMFI